MTTHGLSERSILEVLTRDRLVTIGREFGVSVSPRARKDEQQMAVAHRAPKNFIAGLVFAAVALTFMGLFNV